MNTEEIPFYQMREVQEMEQLYDALVVLTMEDHDMAAEVLNACMGNAQ